MSDTQQQRQSNLLDILSSAQVANPLAAIQQGNQAASTFYDVGQKRFNLQQSQLQPAYLAMRQLMATNDNPSDADVNAALAQSARVGGNIDGLAANYSDFRARGGTPGQWVRAQSLGGMSAENQVNYGVGVPASQDTGAGTVYGMRGGALSGTPGAFAPSSFVQSTLSPAAATDMVQVGTNPDGSAKMVPRWQVSGSGAPGVGPAGVGSGGAAPATGSGGTGAPGTSASGALNNFGNIRAPGGGFASYATPQDGVAAMASNLMAYQDQHGINTLNGITARWAPAGDGANNPAAYAKTLSQMTGIDPNAPLDLHDPATLAKIIPAMAQVEHGRPMGVGGDVLTAGISAGLSGRPASVAAAGPAPAAGPFIGATSAQPVTSGAVRPVGGVQSFDPYGRPIVQGGGGPGVGGGGGQSGSGGGPPAGGYGGYSGLPLGAANVVGGNIQRQQALEQQMNAATSTRATLEGMEAELAKMPPTGVASGALSTIKNLLVQSFGLSQKELDRQAQGLAAQEQFEKFSAMLNQQLLSGMGGQATDARQELTGAATPSSVHSTLGNMGIIHMLEGNLVATQVMGREFAAAVRAGQASPQQFDQWRDDFTKVGPNGARFDPRVFWLSQMGAKEQQAYVNSLTPKDKAQLLRNSNYAEQKGWVFENKDGSMGTGY